MSWLTGWTRNPSVYKIGDMFPLTLRGACFLVGSAILLFMAYTLSFDHVLRVYALGALVLVVLSVLQVLVVAAVYQLRVRAHDSLPPLSAFCGQNTPTGFMLPFPAFLGVEVKWRTPLTGDVWFEDGQECVRFLCRGKAELIQRVITVKDFFGLASIAMTNDEVRTVEVSPAQVEPYEQWHSPVDPSSGEELSAKGRPEGDRYDIREYRQGDSIKYVLWKLTAKRGGARIYVRTQEIVESVRNAYFFLAGAGDDQIAEFCDYLLRTGSLGSNDMFRCSSDQDGDPTDLESARLRLLMSGDADPACDASNFTRFDEEASRQKVGALVILVPSGMSAVPQSFSDLHLPRETRFVTARVGKGCPKVTQILLAAGFEVDVVEMPEMGGA